MSMEGYLNLKLEAVVIPTSNLDKSKDLNMPDAKKIVSSMSAGLSDSPFNETVVQFCQQLSDSLLNNKIYRQHGELVALGFWLRKSHIGILKKHFYSGKNIYRPRGVAFHITPSNVDVMFVYSWVLSLLVGNKNIVRLSSKKIYVQNLLVDIINTLLFLPQFKTIKNNNYFVSYPYDSKITEYFSSVCDIRVIWGGDETIKQIRKYEIQASAREIVFSDRFSFALIAADAVINSNNINRLINDFNKDVYTYTQQACSSPRLIAWLGNKQAISKAKRRFWSEFSQDEKLSEIITASELFDKMVIAQYLAANGHHIDLSLSPYMYRIELDYFNEVIQKLHGGNGLIYEISINKLEELEKISNKYFQTCSYFGVKPEKIEQLIINGQLNDIFRFVPIGRALEFDHIWDGMDLLQEFSRIVRVE